MIENCGQRIIFNEKHLIKSFALFVFKLIVIIFTHLIVLQAIKLNEKKMNYSHKPLIKKGRT